MKLEHISDFIWTPVRTKPRREKKLAEFCSANNILYYLPLNRKLSRYQRRTVEFYVPMFPGYIFCSLDEHAFKRVLQSNAVIYRINLDDAGESELIEELLAVQTIEQMSREKEIIVKPELIEGSKIKICNGSFSGTEGIINRRKGKTLISINIELLNQSVSIEVDAGDLELNK